MNQSRLAGSAEDISAFGEKLNQLYAVEPHIFVVGSIGRFAIRAALLDPSAVSLSVRREEAPTRRFMRFGGQRMLLPALWRDIDIVSPFSSEFFDALPHDEWNHDAIPIDVHLQDFFEFFAGRTAWKLQQRDSSVVLNQVALKPYTRIVDGYPIRTFSAGMQAWIDDQAKIRWGDYNRTGEPTFKQYAEFMGRLQAAPELAVPSELLAG
jgi:hypothetical protein